MGIDNRAIEHIEDWIRRAKMMRDCLKEPDNQAHIDALLSELNELGGGFGQVFTINLEHSADIKMRIELWGIHK